MPVIDIDGVLGGMWADREGYVDTTGTVWAYAGAAKKRGATVIEHNRVLELTHRSDRTWDVVTENGTINAEHVVNAAGLWAKQVGRMVGLRAAGVAARAPLPHHRDDPRSRGVEDRNADGRRPRRLHLYAPGPEGHADRHLRDPHATLVDGRRAVGLRRRASAGKHRPHRGRARTRPSPVSGLAEGRNSQVGQRRFHLLAGRQPARRPGRGQAGLLARLRRDGRVPAGRRRRQGARRMDDPRGDDRGPLRPRYRPLRPLYVQSGIHQADDRRVLRPQVRHDVPRRAIAGGTPAEDDAGLRRHVGCRLPMGTIPGDWRSRSTSARPASRRSRR